jgi:hypothetical protein
MLAVTWLMPGASSAWFERWTRIWWYSSPNQHEEVT